MGPIGLSWGLGSGPNTVFGSSHIGQQVFFSKSSSKSVNLNSSGWPGGWVAGRVGGWVAGFYENITNSAQTEVGAGAELGNILEIETWSTLLAMLDLLICIFIIQPSPAPTPRD